MDIYLLPIIIDKINLKKEKNIKARFNQLLCYKNLGCYTYEEIQKYKFKLCDNKDICPFILNIVNAV